LLSEGCKVKDDQNQDTRKGALTSVQLRTGMVIGPNIPIFFAIYQRYHVIPGIS
jgi:hypothetical protein